MRNMISIIVVKWTILNKSCFDKALVPYTHGVTKTTRLSWNLGFMKKIIIMQIWDDLISLFKKNYTENYQGHVFKNQTVWPIKIFA